MKKFLSIAALVAIFSGCAMTGESPTSTVSNEPKYSKYLENDGTIGEVAFYTENMAQTQRLPEGEIVGIALVKIDGKAVKMGDLHAMNNHMIILQELDASSHFGFRYVNMRDRAEYEKVSAAKRLKFYQFGGGIVESSLFEAGEKAVCAKFNAGEAVRAHVVTNYYDRASADNSEFFATTMDVRAQKGKAAKISNLDFKFFYPAAKLAQVEAAARSDKFKSAVIEKDAKKQEQILSMICAAPAK